MINYLLTYEDAKAIAERYNQKNFWESQYEINGYKVATFNYFICGWDDFENPLPDKLEVNAFDMRGTTFVFDKNGELWERFFMLPKFFNLNQVDATQYNTVKDKVINTISEKEDGSLVAFMMTPDKELFAKTIGSFVSDQAKAAYKILHDSEDHVLWVKDLLKTGYTPLFEYVSWDNRIVLKYKEAHLRYIGVRDNLTGDYFPSGTEQFRYEVIDIPDTVITVKNEIATLDELIEKSKIEENKEGWVVKFEDGQLIKVKTAWYFLLHGLRTENIFREDYVIKNYIEETIDDLISQLDPIEDKDAFDFVEKVSKAVDNYINHIDLKTDLLNEKYKDEYNSDWHYFAKFCHKEPYFGLACSLIKTPDDYHRKKIELILKKTYKLKKAKEIVEQWQVVTMKNN